MVGGPALLHRWRSSKVGTLECGRKSFSVFVSFSFKFSLLFPLKHRVGSRSLPVWSALHEATGKTWFSRFSSYALAVRLLVSCLERWPSFLCVRDKVACASLWSALTSLHSTGEASSSSHHKASSLGVRMSGAFRNLQAELSDSANFSGVFMVWRVSIVVAENWSWNSRERWISEPPDFSVILLWCGFSRSLGTFF